jgi:hypothetical protein
MTGRLVTVWVSLAAVAAALGAGLASVCAGCASNSSPGSSNVFGVSSGGGDGSSSGSQGTSSGTSNGGGVPDATLGGDDGSEPVTDGGAGTSSGSNGQAITRTPINDPSCAANTFTQTSFENLGVPWGTPFDMTQSDVPPDAGAPPTGWNYYNIDGAKCMDGSPMGIYVRFGSTPKLLIYLEGGGACFSPHFCDHNPHNMNTVFPGGSLNGESFAGSLLTQPGLQEPYDSGIFDLGNPQNPFQTWSEIYVPYCTGDAHFGTNDNGQLQDGVNPLQTDTWHFVGYDNMKLFMARIAPTFKNSQYVLLTGSSAGGLGAGLNYGLVQDTFGSNVPVDLIDDSFPPFTGQLISPCLQGISIPLWGFDKSIPSDCAECQQDAGGLANIIVYWHHKYPNARAGLVSSTHDQIIRLFLAAGQNNCTDTDPNLLSGLALLGADPPAFDAGMYENGLDALRTLYGCTNAVATYYIGTGDPDASDMNGSIDTLHEHIFRDRFYDPLAGPSSPTLAQWTGDFVQGHYSQTGP